MLAGSYIWGAISKYQNGIPKVARKAFNIGEVWNPICCFVTKLLSSYCGAHLLEYYCKKIKHFWYKMAKISFFIILDQNLVACMTSFKNNIINWLHWWDCEKPSSTNCGTFKSCSHLWTCKTPAGIPITFFHLARSFLSTDIPQA